MRRSNTQLSNGINVNVLVSIDFSKIASDVLEWITLASKTTSSQNFTSFRISMCFLPFGNSNEHEHMKAKPI